MLKPISRKELEELRDLIRFDENGHDTYLSDLYALPSVKDYPYDLKENSLSILSKKAFNWITPKIIYVVDPIDYLDLILDPDDYYEEDVIRDLKSKGKDVSSLREAFEKFDEILILDPVDVRKRIKESSEDEATWVMNAELANLALGWAGFSILDLFVEKNIVENNILFPIN